MTQSTMLFAYLGFKNFTLIQMDIKSAFLNGFIMKEVYIKQSPGFVNYEFLNNVCKLKKALYGLKQATKAWYDRLKKFLLQNDFKMVRIDTTLFVKFKSQEILLIQIYVVDIIFGYTNEALCHDFAECKQMEFEMSMMGELN